MTPVKFVLALALWGAGLAHSFDFKGLELGAVTTTEAVEKALAYCGPISTSEPCAVAKQDGSVKCGAGANGWKVCNGLTTVAGNAGSVNLVINEQNVVQRISITHLSSSGFDEISEQLTTKFGKPTRRKNSKVQNGYGAIYQQTELIWQNKKGHRIELTEYAGSFERSSLYFAIPQDWQPATVKKKPDL